MHCIIRHLDAWAILVIALLATGLPLHADSIFPVSNFSCTSVDSCSGTATQLPLVGGIEGVEFNVSGFSSDTTFAEFVFSVSGLLSGSSLAVGSAIPYSFILNADSTDPSGTMLDIASLILQSSPGTFNSQVFAITFDGNCAPFPPSPGTTHWCRTVQGSGLLSFPQGLNGGDLLVLGGKVDVAGHSNSGQPGLNFTATLDFNPVPEPRYAFAALLVLAGLLAIGSAVRNWYSCHGRG
jgi:hypothetical protein